MDYKVSFYCREEDVAVVFVYSSQQPFDSSGILKQDIIKYIREQFGFRPERIDSLEILNSTPLLCEKQRRGEVLTEDKNG